MNNTKTGLCVAYYLARYNETAYKNLNFGNQEQTHKEIGRILNVKPTTVQNWRDEFDPLFGHRAGWYQRPLSPSRRKVAEAFENLDEYSLRSIVTDILTNRQTPEAKESVEEIINVISSGKERKKSDFTTRGITGKKAETYFIKWIEENKNHFIDNATIEDVRDHGCGYDFKIRNEEVWYAIEVKGILSEHGSILFTQKEWETAARLKENYYLIIVSNIEKENHKVRIINDPFNNFNPKKNIQTIIQVNWCIAENEVRNIPSL